MGGANGDDDEARRGRKGSDCRERTVAVCGAGLVGALAALVLKRHGWAVELYDGRQDPRSVSSSGSKRSINLALSARGLHGLKQASERLADEVLASAIPMRGRMIHDLQGKEQGQDYGLYGECINSIDRGFLNNLLIDRAQQAGVIFRPLHKLLTADLEHGELSFEVKSPEGPPERKIVRADLILGCDGAHSVVRTALDRHTRLDFSQIYIPHAYLELKIPARLVEGKAVFAISPNHLHIWPRQTFMLIALPNPDKSFTSTLFMPFERFDALQSRTQVMSFFKTEFFDALNLIGEDSLWSDWQNNPRSSLVQMSAYPYHYKSKALIIGDAAHSMVPFYGQGMNCGFEDVAVLSDLLQQEGVSSASPDVFTDSLGQALNRYSKDRHEDLLAILKLAMANHHEMQSAVTSPIYKLRKRIDALLSKWMPRGSWTPLYTMVSFREDIPYSKALEIANRQSTIIDRLGATALSLGALALVMQAFHHLRGNTT